MNGTYEQNPGFAPGADCRQSTLGKYEGVTAPSSIIHRRQRVRHRGAIEILLPLSIFGRKMCVSGHTCPEMPFYRKWMFPSKACFSWLSMAGCRLCRRPETPGFAPGVLHAETLNSRFPVKRADCQKGGSHDPLSKLCFFRLAFSGEPVYREPDKPVPAGRTACFSAMKSHYSLLYCQRMK